MDRTADSRTSGAGGTFIKSLQVKKGIFRAPFPEYPIKSNDFIKVPPAPDNKAYSSQIPIMLKHTYLLFLKMMSLKHILSPEGFAVSGVSAKFAGTPEAPSPRELAKPSGFD